MVMRMRWEWQSERGCDVRGGAGPWWSTGAAAVGPLWSAFQAVAGGGGAFAYFQGVKCGFLPTCKGKVWLFAYISDLPLLLRASRAGGRGGTGVRERD